jgi:hypothetical protein
MSQVRVYSEYSSDGIDELCVCDDTQHYRLFKPDWGDEESRVSHQEPCDGTCQNRDWKHHILEQIEQVRGATIQVEGGKVLPSHIEISSEAQAILDREQIIGVRIMNWYAKRCGEGETYLLADGQHLVVTIDYNWWSCDGIGRYKTIKVKVEHPGKGDDI